MRGIRSGKNHIRLDQRNGEIQNACSRKLVAPGIACNVVSGLHLYDHQVKINEVYLGARNPLLRPADREVVSIDRTLEQTSTASGWSVRQVQTTDESWEPVIVDLGADALLIPQRRKGLTQSFSFDAETGRFLHDKLARSAVQDNDNFELTTWNGEHFLKKNGGFI